MKIVLGEIWSNEAHFQCVKDITVQSAAITAIHVGARYTEIFGRHSAGNDLLQHPGLSVHMGKETVGIRQRELPIHLEDLARAMEAAEGIEKLKNIPVHFIKNKDGQQFLSDFLTPKGWD